MTPETQERMAALVAAVRQGPIMRRKLRTATAVVVLMATITLIVSCEVIGRLVT